ncbi:PLP-dependent transferase, partial [Testicularia cyperi]
AASLPATPPLPAPSSGIGAATKKDFAVGTSIPANMPHAVSVSLPLWSDNVDYEEGRLTNSMETGYPRFFIHRSIQKLASLLSKKFGKPDESCILFPTARVADRCRDYMRHQHLATQSTSPPTQSSLLPVRIVRFSMLENKSNDARTDHEAAASSSTAQHVASASPDLESTSYAAGTTAHYIFIVFFPSDAFPLAKSFWQHTGDGISSRQAERCMALLERNGSLEDDDGLHTNGSSTSSDARTHATVPATSSDDIFKKGGGGSSSKRFYNRYARTNSAASGFNAAAPNMTPSPSSTAPNTPTASTILQRPATGTETSGSASPVIDSMGSEHVTYLEERYGRNLPLSSAASAKLALRRRIAGTLLSDRSAESAVDVPRDEVGESGRKDTGITENDVYLYPCGMSAIFHAHQLAMLARQRQHFKASTVASHEHVVGKSVCFGFPYTDTLKILQKFGPGCHFFGLGTDADLDALEALLEQQQAQSTASQSPEPPILALFCEFPSNPLLRSPNLPRIRALADRYGFMVVIDETIGNFVNVEVLPYADILVSSLTKVFSGDANVMGGSMVLNPKSPLRSSLQAAIQEHYEDTYFEEDAIFMERNSRDFIRRIVQIDRNTQAVTSLLWNERQGKGDCLGVVKEVYYPKFQTRENYEVCRRRQAFNTLAQMGLCGDLAGETHDAGTSDAGGGYGGLFSITFHSERASEAFYDSLDCAKGPSLGTNLTLACPYTILAHYGELDWAAQFGVEKGLVRVSVGLEDVESLTSMFRNSLKAAAEAHAA